MPEERSHVTNYPLYYQDLEDLYKRIDNMEEQIHLINELVNAYDERQTARIEIIERWMRTQTTKEDWDKL